jgi:hypothetical protein
LKLYVSGERGDSRSNNARLRGATLEAERLTTFMTSRTHQGTIVFTLGFVTGGTSTQRSALSTRQKLSRTKSLQHDGHSHPWLSVV